LDKRRGEVVSAELLCGRKVRTASRRDFMEGGSAIELGNISDYRIFLLGFQMKVCCWVKAVLDMGAST
jgi:hypothetical protein